MRLLVENIGCLVNTRSSQQLLRGKSLAELPTLTDAFLIVENGRIADYGKMDDLARFPTENMDKYDAAGAYVLPAWCDSHTHLVFAASRENEFVDKLKGRSYAEIAAAGGGILASAQKLQLMSEEELFELAWGRLSELIALGTGAIEIKSGYGLSVEAELKMLRVIQRLKMESPIPVKRTFLGAHSFPIEYRDKKEAYIDLILHEMLPVISNENLADYIDVFCEEGFYTLEQTRRILEAGIAIGLKAKLHANQLSASGAVELGVTVGALSVDHLEVMTESAINCLAGSNTIATLLPTAAFFLRMPFQPARALIDANCAVALASDFNPGSSPSGNMNLVVAMSCIQMKMLPEEAINAATLNGAYAMGLENELGSISVGKRANLIFTSEIPSLAYLPYSFGTNLIKKVMINGIWYKT